MSTPRKRTKAEAERVRQMNLLARLWQSRMLANGLLAGSQQCRLTALRFGYGNIPAHTPGGIETSWQ